jgi:Ca2+-transporting ATPase
MGTYPLLRPSRPRRPPTQPIMQTCVIFFCVRGPYSLPVLRKCFLSKDVVKQFRSSSTHGLTAAVIPSLRQAHGYNELAVSAPEPPFLKFAKMFYESRSVSTSPSSSSSLVCDLRDTVESIELTRISVGFVQERRSEESLEALNKFVPHHCHIIRDGEQIHLLANEVVPGDLVTFTTGDRIPADVRLLTAVELEVDESSLTGETTAHRKAVAPCPERTEMAERTCMAYLGTLVRNGTRFRAPLHT